ncbi:hypothetical protein ACIP1T_26335 [Pseudomonas japonica]|uniref:hypothetical protein n=1 Tax=Pseudomonas japonica TaxID=256466 RepID=UPI003802A90E
MMKSVMFRQIGLSLFAGTLLFATLPAQAGSWDMNGCQQNLYARGMPSGSKIGYMEDLRLCYEIASCPDLQAKIKAVPKPVVKLDANGAPVMKDDEFVVTNQAQIDTAATAVKQACDACGARCVR